MIDMKVNARPTTADWQEFTQDWRQCNSSISFVHWYSAGLVAALVLVSSSTYTSLFGYFHLPTAGFLVLMLALLAIPLVLNFMELSTAAQPSAGGVFLGPQTYRFRNAGIEISGPAHSTTLSWASIRGVKETDNLVILMFDSAHGILLPKRDIQDADELFRTLNTLLQSGRSCVSRKHAEDRRFSTSQHLPAVSEV